MPRYELQPLLFSLHLNPEAGQAYNEIDRFLRELAVISPPDKLDYEKYRTAKLAREEKRTYGIEKGQVIVETKDPLTMEDLAEFPLEAIVKYAVGEKVYLLLITGYAAYIEKKRNFLTQQQLPTRVLRDLSDKKTQLNQIGVPLDKIRTLTDALAFLENPDIEKKEKEIIEEQRRQAALPINVLTNYLHPFYLTADNLKRIVDTPANIQYIFNRLTNDVPVRGNPYTREDLFNVLNNYLGRFPDQAGAIAQVLRTII